MKYFPKSIRNISMVIFIAMFFIIIPFVSAEETDNGAAVDSDNDGYTNAQEIKAGYSPYNPSPVKLQDNDADKDGLSDYWELQFGTDPLNPDTDGDGYKDGEEIDHAFSALSSGSIKLPQTIKIDLKKQQLTYLIDNKPWKQFTVSTGKPSMPTPKGTFKVINKDLKAWSSAYKLWMPYWMGLGHGQFGIHELPLWPNGYHEGQNHLGKPVSHGCIRLGIGPAQYLFERIPVGTEVVIE